MPRQLPPNDLRKDLPELTRPDKKGRSQLVDTRQITLPLPLDGELIATYSYAAHERHPDGTPMGQHHAMESFPRPIKDLPIAVRDAYAVILAEGLEFGQSVLHKIIDIDPPENIEDEEVKQ